jgi:possible ATPase
MSPASLPKSGSHFDLPMALAILAAHVEQHGADYARSVQSPNRVLEETLVLGELGLDGTVRAVPGIIPALLAAREEGISTLVIPPGNAAEATLVPDLNVLVAATLFDAFAWALGERDLPRAAECCSDQPAAAPAQERLDFCDIAGQHHAKWAAEVAAAGGHHLLMIGPPGSGKSMIASRLPSILPALSPDQMVETTAVHSLTGTPW